MPSQKDPVKDSVGTQYAFNPIIDPAGVVAQYRELAADYEEKVHQSNWVPYVTNQEDFVRNGITVGYFVYRKL